MTDVMSRLTIKLRANTDLTLDLSPVLPLSLTPVTVGDPSSGADGFYMLYADHSVGFGFTHSELPVNVTDLSWLTVKIR